MITWRDFVRFALYQPPAGLRYNTQEGGDNNPAGVFPGFSAS